MRLLLVVDKYNTKYIHAIRRIASQHEFIVPKVTGITLMRTHWALAKKMDCAGMVCCCAGTLSKLVNTDTNGDVPVGDPSVTLNNFKGSVYQYKDLPIVVLNNLQTIYTMSYGEMVATRYLNKITGDTPIPQEPEFSYTKFKGNERRLYQLAKQSRLVAVDIETLKVQVDVPELEILCNEYDTTSQGMWADIKPHKNSKTTAPCVPLIDMVGYSLLLTDNNGKLYSTSFTIPLNSTENLGWVRRFNTLDNPKVLQNGSYDATYFIRFGCPLTNWLHDTFHFMHSWYAEIPRDLGFIGSLFLSKHRYWKEEITTNRLEYCAKDVHVTLWSYIFMVKEAPHWVLLNYRTVFKKCFPNITAGLEGDRIDFEERDRLHTYYTDKLMEAGNKLDTITGGAFNPNSSKQVKKLMQSTQSPKVESSDKHAMRRWAERHPLNQYLKEAISDYREASKKISTYIGATDFDGRLLYEINASGTDTSRSSSKASNLWTGTQRQNIDGKCKSMYIADPGYVYAASDAAQAESRTTAYISEDPNLIDAVEHAPDFHTRNAGLFFGMEENQITKVLRTLGKRVNHGANYNMGANVLIGTMGMRMILEAKYLLGLHHIKTLKGIAEYLLNQFDKTYPLLRTKYYDEVIEEVLVYGSLTIPCEEIHWKRICFDTPSRDPRSKPALNKYVAHMPQGLSSQIVDKAWFDFWHKWQLVENCVRVKAQVHDEIQYQILENHPRKDEVGADLKLLMSRPYTVRGRTLRIPADSPIYGHRLSDVKD